MLLISCRTKFLCNTSGSGKTRLLLEAVVSESNNTTINIRVNNRSDPQLEFPQIRHIKQVVEEQVGDLDNKHMKLAVKVAATVNN